MSKSMAMTSSKQLEKSRRSKEKTSDSSNRTKRARSSNDTPPAIPRDDIVAKESNSKTAKPLPTVEEKSFPRGGASLLTPIERKQIHIQADRDALFEESGKKRPRPQDVSDSEQSDVVVEREQKPKKRRIVKVSGNRAEPSVDVERIQSLSFKKLRPGSLVLGQVTQITSRDVAIALPNSLTGYVPLTSISRQLTDRVASLLEETAQDEEDAMSGEFEDVDIKRLFRKGQYLRAAVVSNDTTQGSRQKKHIELSLDPRLANAGLTKDDLVVNNTIQASVVSVEDNGLIVDLGIDGCDARGFISAGEVGTGVKHGDFEVGAVVLCIVIGLSGNGRVVKLSSDTTRIGNAKKGGHVMTAAPSVTAFLPGTATNIIVSDATNHGIRASIMGLIDVTADFVHAGGAQSMKGLENEYKPGAKLQARVIFSLPNDDSQRIGVSVAEHLLSLSSDPLRGKGGASPLEQLPYSSTVEHAKVVKVDTRNGLYLDVGIPGVLAFAHVSRLSDKKIDNILPDTGPYKIGSVHRARVLGYSAIDGLFSVSLEESTLNQPFLRLEDVKPGQLVDGTIENMPIKGDGITGILVQLTDGIRGFVPVDHISDIKLKHPERKYRTGMKVKARVLSSNVEKQSIYLTMKKTLVTSESDPWISYESLEIGKQSPGSITKLTPTGAWVQFYGDVRAFLPVGEMSEAYIKDPAEHFRVGQVVNVHIISVDQQGKRMLVSCKDLSSFSKDREERFKEFYAGQVVHGNIVELANDLVTVELDGGVQGHLRVEHLTDGGAKKNAAALTKLRAGMKLQNLVVLKKLENSRTIVLSNKPNLVRAAQDGKFLTSFDQLKPGEKVDGFISNITVTGIFVEFGNNLGGLIPLAGMLDTMKSLQMQNFGLETGLTITTTVWRIYADDMRFTLTLRDYEPVATTKHEIVGHRAPRQLENPVDGSLVTVDELTIGKQTLVRVNAIKELQLNVSFADNVNGRIHVTEVFKTFDEIEDPMEPLKGIKHNAVLPVTVIGLHNTKTYKFLPFSHRQSVHPVYECSHRHSDTSNPEMLSLLKLAEGEERLAFIFKYANSHALASLSPEIHGSLDVVDLASIDTQYQQAFPIGCALRVKIRKIDLERSRVYLMPVAATPSPARNFEVGSVYLGRVRRSHADGLDVQLSPKIWGLVPLTELSDDYEQARPEMWTAKDTLKVKVLAKPAAADRLVLSARPSLTGPNANKVDVRDRHISGTNDLEFCGVARGFVKNISKQGMLVRLGWNTVAQVPVHDLSDQYIKDYMSAFKARQLVTGKIIKVDVEEGHHKMSLRESVIQNPNFEPELGFADIEIGDVVDAVVVQVESFGVFVRINRSRNIRGLCHVKELASTRVEDPSKLYSEGDLVKAKIIKLDRARRHINFSLKAVHFQGETERLEDDGGAERMLVNDIESNGVDLQDVQVAITDHHDDIDGGENGDDNDTGADQAFESAHEVATDQSNITHGLQAGAFDWSGLGGNDHVVPLLDNEQELPKKKRRRAELQEDKTGDLDALGPQSGSDFERMLLGQPNSSALWIQYMAFELGLSEIDKARDIAERAIRTIHMREDEEKLNVWTALLNLENTYGSEGTLDSVFERACQMSDKSEVHMRLASIFIDSGKHREAEALFERMRKIRDLSSDPGYWTNYATFLMTTLNRADDGRALLQRATQSVPAHQHVHLISRFGALEYASPNGDVERGRTIFEGLIDAHKNGHDLWDQYLAQEMALINRVQGAGKDAENVRRLFERMTKMKMKAKRAKYVFKKWLNWEKGLLATGESSDRMMIKVKEIAGDWVEREGKGKDLNI